MFTPGIARRIAPTVAILLVILLTLSACSTSSSKSDTTPRASNAADDATTSMPRTQEQEKGMSVSGGATTSGEMAASAPQPVAGFERLVIRNAQLDLRVTDVTASISAVRDLAVSQGGFVFASSTQSHDTNQYAQVTIRVPADHFDQTMSTLRTASWVDTVEREESSAQDVSADYVDNEARMASLRTTQDRLMALLEKAESIDDILRLETELTNIRTQIEQIQGRLNYLDNATSYATIAVSLAPVGVPAITEQDGFSLSAIFSRAWQHSRSAIEDVLVATITAGIFAAFLLPLMGVVYLVWRRMRPRTAKESQ